MTNATTDKSKNVAPSQVAKFKAMAKELETDDNEIAFDAKLKTLAKAKEKPAKGK
jgi:hypothetical protein